MFSYCYSSSDFPFILYAKRSYALAMLVHYAESHLKLVLVNHQSIDQALFHRMFVYLHRLKQAILAEIPKLKSTYITRIRLIHVH